MMVEPQAVVQVQAADMSVVLLALLAQVPGMQAVPSSHSQSAVATVHPFDDQAASYR